jgi:hypothetical protein
METRITKADLTVIDAALKLHGLDLKAARAEVGIAINPGDLAFTPVVEVAVAVVEVTLVAYHVYNSWLQGADRTLTDVASRAINVKTTASLVELVAARNQIAKQLGVAPLEVRVG